MNSTERSTTRRLSRPRPKLLDEDAALAVKMAAEARGRDDSAEHTWFEERAKEATAHASTLRTVLKKLGGH